MILWKISTAISIKYRILATFNIKIKFNSDSLYAIKWTINTILWRISCTMWKPKWVSEGIFDLGHIQSRLQCLPAQYSCIHTTYTVNSFGKAFAHVRNCLLKKKHMAQAKTLTDSTRKRHKKEDSTSFVLLTTLELFWLYFLREKTDMKFIILASNLKDIPPSVFSWKKEYIKNYAKTTQKGGFNKLCVQIKKRCDTDLLHFSTLKIGNTWWNQKQTQTLQRGPIKGKL
jgi:hypothetical protein